MTHLFLLVLVLLVGTLRIDLADHFGIIMIIFFVWCSVTPLSPHDALKHHFTFLKTDLIFLQPRVLER